MWIWNSYKKIFQLSLLAIQIEKMVQIKIINKNLKQINLNYNIIGIIRKINIIESYVIYICGIT